MILLHQVSIQEDLNYLLKNVKKTIYIQIITNKLIILKIQII